MSNLHKRLNYGELANLADLYVWTDYDAGVYHGFKSDMQGKAFNDLRVMLDAEGKFVCLVPRLKAEYMERLINTYEHKTHFYPDGIEKDAFLERLADLCAQHGVNLHSSDEYGCDDEGNDVYQGTTWTFRGTGPSGEWKLGIEKEVGAAIERSIQRKKDE